MYRLRADIGGRHSGAESQGALAREAWVVDRGRAGSPLLWEQLGCTFSRRLCALGVVRLADVYGGVLLGGAGGRWLGWSEVQAIYGGEGVAFTQADGREYERLLRELDGRSWWQLSGDARAAPCLMTATAEWRAARARDRPEVDCELRMARAWLERKLAGGLPPEAVRAARRGGEGREFLVREQGALVDTWWAEALLSERLGLLEGEERVRLEVEARSARVDLAPRSFSGWLAERGARHVLETAARESDASEVSEARCELVCRFYDGYSPAAMRAQAGATPIVEALEAREALRHTAPPQQSLFKGDREKDETTGKRRASLAQSQADIDAGRRAVQAASVHLGGGARGGAAVADGLEAMTALLDDGEARFWRTLPGERDGTYVARAGALRHPVARGFVRLRCLECPEAAEMEPMRARSMRRRGAEAVDVVMPPFERAKASAAASKHFFLLLLGMWADGGCTHFAFTDGSKVGAEASRDGAAHAACGVFEGASMVCGAVVAQ